jgi:hypothetical protein
MATTRKSSTKSAPAEETVVETADAPTVKSQINDGITAVVEATGVDSQKARYKAMRAIAYVAFAKAVEDGTFDDLVQEAIDGANDLPTGWQLERSVAAEKPAPKAKAAPAKAPAKTAAKRPAAKSTTSARKRPTR